MIMQRLLRFAFWLFVARPLALIVLGVNVRHRQRLPTAGPAIVAANHNSHLDTLVLLSLFPLRLLPRLRPVAAADYFTRNRLLAWFSLKVIGILPIQRAGKGGVDPLKDCEAALDRGDILILFPEGSRGEPEVLGRFKRGIAVLAARRREVPVTPVFLHGLGKALPKGEPLLVPFFCDAFVGEALHGGEDQAAFMAELEARMRGLAAELPQGADWAGEARDADAHPHPDPSPLKGEGERRLMRRAPGDVRKPLPLEGGGVGVGVSRRARRSSRRH